MSPTSQSHELTPLVWVGLGIAGLALAMSFLTEQTPIQMLVPRKGEKPIIIRSQNQTHQFPLLGAEVRVSPGWSYLAVNEDHLADRPAFVHQASNSVVRLQANVLEAWPPRGVTTKPEIGMHPAGTLEWVRVDHLRIGKLLLAKHGLTIVAIQHGSQAEVNESIEEFCAGIRHSDSEH
ncbi:hypothetical protein OAG76_03895 [Rubripirellula sp.]|jgi:hypothetical protein|nr:hypothetical protein [Rubripirellula sp.]MDB4634529.1 hypothetical protein [Rubripirellula sp.]MDC0288727.1 hypothetical protein [Rubripirellula sp.]